MSEVYMRTIAVSYPADNQYILVLDDNAIVIFESDGSVRVAPNSVLTINSLRNGIRGWEALE
jgi:hypothetical protein